MTNKLEWIGIGGVVISMIVIGISLLSISYGAVYAKSNEIVSLGWDIFLGGIIILFVSSGYLISGVYE
jgi:hypothetical protein